MIKLIKKPRAGVHLVKLCKDEQHKCRFIFLYRWRDQTAVVDVRMPATSKRAIGTVFTSEVIIM